MNKVYSKDLIVAATNVLHNIFYKKPKADYLIEIAATGLLDSWPHLGNISTIESATKMMYSSLIRETEETIERDFYALFIGPGPIFAYPWGSVYLDQDNLMYSKSTIAFERFCYHYEIVLNTPKHEPKDHIGIMLAVLSSLLKEENNQALIELLSEHLMPWAPRMLDYTIEHSSTGYYQGAAILTKELLFYLAKELKVKINIERLYF